MQETNKRENTPGLSKVKSSLDDFKKSQMHEIINPTLQYAQEALPVVEKSVEFREGRAGTPVMPQWLTPEVAKVAVSIEYTVPNITTEIIEKPKKAEKKSAYDKVAKVEKAKPIESVKPIKHEQKIETPSDLEIVLNSNTVEPKQKQPDVFDTMSFASVVPEVEQEKTPEINVFENLNTMQPVEEKQDNTVSLLNSKPIMVVDKVEIRSITNDNGETAYMIGKKECSQKDFEEYMQSVRGKIISLDCKKLEIAGNSYTKQNNGTYKDLNNNILSIDDVLNLLH